MRQPELSPVEATFPVDPPVGGAEDARRMIGHCHALLAERCDVSSERLANEVLASYRSLTGWSLTSYFDSLTSEFCPDFDLVRRWADAYRREPSAETLVELQRAAESPRQELFRRLNLVGGGTVSLLDMRRHLLRGLAEHPEWASVAADLAHLFRAWFNGGLLEFRRIDWRTSPAVLENLIKYEAVHKIRDWRALRRRLQEDRRCFGFFHPALPDEPLVFTELALTARVSAKIQPLLDPDSAVLEASSRKCAMFYSISSCHDGLRGVSLGNALIRRAIDNLRLECPRLKTFATLSPIPGFRAWLNRLLREEGTAGAGVAALLNDSGWLGDAAQSDALERELMPLCASYLLVAKRGQEPADAVARFHLANGARLERLNWLGDTSEAGIDRSAGLTANYLYRVADIERNHRAYVSERKVTAARSLQRLQQTADLVRLAHAS